jgi:hypothetical protein
MQSLKDTDAVIFMDFNAAGKDVKSKLDANATREDRIKMLSGFVSPYLKRLAANGWSQRDRMLTLIQLWDEIK